MPLGKIARFNNKVQDFGQPLKIVEHPEDDWTLATTVSLASTEIDNPIQVLEYLNTCFDFSVSPWAS